MRIQYSARQKRLTLAIGVALAVGQAQADFGAELNLSSLNGSNGFAANGAAADDQTGRSVSFAGDLNGDGFDDLVIGAPYASAGAVSTGKVYVLFGTSQGFAPALSLSALDGSDGFVITGEAIFDNAGFAVAAAGDVNGDGIDDLLIGAVGTSRGANYAGSTYVIYGDNAGFTSPFDLSDVNGANGAVIDGHFVYSESGKAVSSAGDINGDGIDDLIIGAPYAGGGAGASYVIFGNDAGLASPLSTADLDGTNGFSILGVAEGDSSGFSVGGAGDINGDGVDDVIIGAPLAGPPGDNPGAAYVVFGNGLGFSSELNLSALDGTDGFALNGAALSDATGTAVGMVGDVNGDGLEDLIIGAPGSDPNGSSSGSSYVVFGSNQALPSVLELSGLNGTNGFAAHGEGAGDESGSSAGAAGDIDNDGVADLIIGAPLADPNGSESGASYVLFGSNQAWPTSVSLSGLSGADGFRINGVSAGDESGRSVGFAGDVNADGTSDLLVGAPLDDPNGADSGAAYVLFGLSDVVGDVIFANGFE